MSILAIDTFDRANNADLGTAWDVVSGEAAFQILSNAAAPSSPGSDCGESYNGITWPADQYSQGPITTIGGGPGTGIGFLVRASTVARTYYRAIIEESGGNWELARFAAGIFASLATGTTTYVAGAILRIDAQGAAPVTLRVIYNGVTLTTQTDSVSPIATGRAGINASGGFTSGSIASWEGGDFATGGRVTKNTEMPRGVAKGFSRGFQRPPAVRMYSIPTIVIPKIAAMRSGKVKWAA